MYSLRYGTVPLIRSTGGLEDSITHFDPKTGNGNGFKFYNYTRSSLQKTLIEALELYQKPKL